LQKGTGGATYAITMKPIDLALIQARRAKIASEMAEENNRFEGLQRIHEHRLADLEGELHELDIAERVFAKLSGETSAPTPAGSTGKPANTPPMTDMIREALEHARGLGTVRLRPAEILSYIQGKWWPNAEPNAVGPIAWRMWQREELAKFKDGTYSLPSKKEEAAA
jgi:hypothetical protein